MSFTLVEIPDQKTAGHWGNLSPSLHGLAIDLGKRKSGQRSDDGLIRRNIWSVASTWFEKFQNKNQITFFNPKNILLSEKKDKISL